MIAQARVVVVVVVGSVLVVVVEVVLVEVVVVVVVAGGIGSNSVQSIWHNICLNSSLKFPSSSSHQRISFQSMIRNRNRLMIRTQKFCPGRAIRSSKFWGLNGALTL
jgi:hypothetical protein